MGKLNAQILRHKTAIRRTDLSRPARLVLEHGILKPGTTFFDYGCGRGDDVERLSQQGIEARGWDPIHNSDSERAPADIVNLGYVINVIENPAERIRAVKEAWSLTRKLLIVSARLNIEANNGALTSPYRDGCLTSRGTFQKFYDQRELSDWINDTLGLPGVAVAPGIFYVFRDDDFRQSFVASRFRRTTVIPRQKYSHDLFEKNREAFNALIQFIASRGRLPHQSEFDTTRINQSVGSLQRAFGIIKQVTGTEQWDRIREERAQDVLVYLALSRFSRRPRSSELAFDLRMDIRAFFSTYRRACEQADSLLFSAGKADMVNEACKNSVVGKQTPDALYVHVTGLPFLPPILRVYEGCARAYIGAVDGANVIKLSRSRAQVSYLYYPRFERDPHPALAASLVVPLQTFHIRYDDYGESRNPYILHRKETLVPPSHSLREKFARLTAQEERFGLYENPLVIGTQDGWQRVLDGKGVVLTGHRVRRKKTSILRRSFRRTSSMLTERDSRGIGP